MVRQGGLRQAVPRAQESSLPERDAKEHVGGAVCCRWSRFSMCIYSALLLYIFIIYLLFCCWYIIIIYIYTFGPKALGA